MLYIAVDDKTFEYDIHSLVKAFYPQKDVKVIWIEEMPNLYKQGELEDEGFFCMLKSDEFMLCKCKKEPEVSYEVLAAEKITGKDLSEKSFHRNEIKRLIYRVISGYENKSLPWGSLTGVRPSKISLMKLEDGFSKKEAIEFLENEYYASSEKAFLATDIADRERNIIKSLYSQTADKASGVEHYSLYVGIPFCPTTCLYCSFASYPVSAFKDLVEVYLDTLIRELQEVSEIGKSLKLDTVYIGGGTPTALSAEQLERLLSALDEYFPMDTILEYTVEAGRADSITVEKLRVLKAHRVTRISVNPQTMQDETLKRIGRQHNANQVEEAFELARQEGFDNINMDTILGLPGETIEDIRYTFGKIQELKPDSLTVHSLAIKRASKLRHWVEENGANELMNSDEFMAVAMETAEELGLKPYYMYRQKNMTGNLENIGFAREGVYGLYNILMMEEVQSIIACGAGTVTKRVQEDGAGGFRIERCDNVKDVVLYINKIDEMIERKRQLFSTIECDK